MSIIGVRKQMKKNKLILIRHLKVKFDKSFLMIHLIIQTWIKQWEAKRVMNWDVLELVMRTQKSPNNWHCNLVKDQKLRRLINLNQENRVPKVSRESWFSPHPKARRVLRNKYLLMELKVGNFNHHQISQN